MTEIKPLSCPMGLDKVHCQNCYFAKVCTVAEGRESKEPIDVIELVARLLDKGNTQKQEAL